MNLNDQWQLAGLTQDEIDELTKTGPKAELFKAIQNQWVHSFQGLGHEEITQRNAKLAANWFLGDFTMLLHDADLDLDSPDMKLTAGHFAVLLALRQTDQISGSVAKQLLQQAFQTGRDPIDLLQEQGLGTIKDEGAIAEAVARAIAAKPEAVADYKAGKIEALNALLGQVMKETRGRADAGEVRAILQAELDKS